MQNSLSSVELCAGAGGQALGLENAGFLHEAVVEIDSHCRETLLLNRPDWNILEEDNQDDLQYFNGKPFQGVDLVAGGLPCPPFSIAGKQLGHKDERNLFPSALRIIDEIRPRAVMIENVRGFLGAVFSDYRQQLKQKLKKMGYETDWHLFNASDFGVSQLRPRVVIVAMRSEFSDQFSWPDTSDVKPPTVGKKLYDLMHARGWKGARNWSKEANDIAPTIVGGSKKHGGPDLGPTRSKQAWALLGVDGMGIADEPPPPDFNIKGMPKLTVQMVARLQGFPDSWEFAGRKTAAYRQVGNAFPPPVAEAVATKISEAISSRKVFKAAANG
jgi:DNA (cytosine-5)-methyltransferase 1